MTLATIVISAICILLVLGYRFDIKDRTLEQGALLQFRSTPTGATIILDGVKQSFTTPGKLEVKSGSHTIEFQREKYHPWQKTVSLDAGELRWLNYARFVPETIETKSVLSIDTASSALPTPDRKFLAAVTEAKAGTVTIYDLRDIARITAKSYTIPTEIYTQHPEQPGVFAIEEWDFGSRYLLMSYTNATAKQFIRLDRTTASGSPYNLTNEFNLPFSSVHFSGTSGALLYALTGQDLRKVDTGNKSVSQPIVTGVTQYRLYRENDIAFAAVRDDKKVAGVYLDGKEHIVKNFAVSDDVMVDITEYFSHFYLAITHMNHIEIIKDPTEVSQVSAGRAYASFDMPYRPTWIDFGSSGRFLIVGSGRAYDKYDLETDEHVAVNPDEVNAAQAAPTWLDDYYLVDNPTGTVRIYEFDGKNRHTIAAAEPSLPAFLTENGKYLISFVKKNDKLSLQTSRLILD